jgi:anti-sigma factor RsiW
MKLTDDMLIAYADDELSGEELRAVEAGLKDRPDLAAFVERQRTLRRQIESSFAPILDEEVPQALRDAVFRTPVSWQWQWNRAPDGVAKVFSRRMLMWSGVPAAAALAFGVLLGVAIAPDGVFRVDNTGFITAHGVLAAALERQLASAQNGNESVRIGFSFHSRDGHYCRTFEEPGASASVGGVACHDGKTWSVRALAATSSDLSQYRMAGGMPDILRRVVSDTIMGQPLDAAAERQARDRGWTAR